MGLTPAGSPWRTVLRAPCLALGRGKGEGGQRSVPRPCGPLEITDVVTVGLGAVGD